MPTPVFLRTSAALAAALALAMTLGGCASLYFPPPPHAPLLTQKGEVYGSLSTNQHTNFALQGAYAATDHLAVAGTFSSLHHDKKNNTENFDFGEASLGYFTRLPDRRVLEIYGGLGLGTTRRIERNPERVTERILAGNLRKYFVQVNYARKKTKTLHLFRHDFPLTYGAALRLSHVALHDFRIDGQLRPGEANVFFEPITFTRVQLSGPFYLQLMSGQCLGLRRNEFLRAANSVFQVGIIFNLNERTLDNWEP